MKLLVVSTMAALGVGLSSSVFANCGPGTEMPQPQQQSTPANHPGRQKWVRHRIEHLEKRREHYENEKFRNQMLMTPLDGQASDVVEIARFKMWEASTQPVRKRERVEELMLKRENGSATPAENAALDKWLRQHPPHR